MYLIAIKMLMGDTAKYIALVLGVAFSTMLMSNQATIFAGIMERAANQISEVREADLWVMDKRVRYFEETEQLTQTQLWRVRGIEGVRWAVPLFKGLAMAHAPGGGLRQVHLMGVDDATLTGVCPEMVIGSKEDLKIPDGVIIDRAGYRFLFSGTPKLGGTIEINEHRGVIAGICDAAPPFTTFPLIFAKYSDAERYVGNPRKPITFILVAAEPNVDQSSLANRIEATTGLQVLGWKDFASQTIWYYVHNTGLGVNFAVTVILGFIIGAVVVGQMFHIFVLENLRHFATLKAVGISNGTMSRMILVQGLVVGAIGYNLGMAVSAEFFAFVRSLGMDFRGFYLSWQVMVSTGVAIALIMLLATGLSIRRLSKIDPVSVFKS
ncbi:MAG TPA: ABC transporter permease [Candidatus Binataceae bacterium]|nr:ABC transporter permease [Candidatus Binataceae bacterium]